MNFVGKAFDELVTGETFGQSLTIDESHLSRACGMFGDFNPLHSDAVFAAGSRFGQRILHGPMTSAAISASVGMYFYGTAVAYLEHNCRFISPVFAGDTLAIVWTIDELIAKPHHNGGIAVMTATCTNQRNQQVAQADGKIMLLNRQPGVPV
jgi:acyl dehydratase